MTILKKYRMILVLLFALVFSGCFMIGDGFVHFKGEVVSQSGIPVSGCEMALFVEGKEGNFDIATKQGYLISIKPRFENGFDISPAKKGYFFMVRCLGYSKAYRSEIYVFDGITYTGERLDLGKIVMKE